MSLESQEVREILRQVVREELANLEHPCRFNVTKEEAHELGHFTGMLKDLGDGRFAGGIEAMRENHKWMLAQRRRGQKLSTAFLIIVMTSAAGGLFAALWLGIKALLTKGPTG